MTEDESLCQEESYVPYGQINWSMTKHIDAKQRINQLLWSILPDRTTLYEADMLSNSVLRMIEECCKINVCD